MRILLVSALIFILFTQSWAFTRHVPRDYETIQRAVNASHNLDSILVAPGIYEESISIDGVEVTIGSQFMFDGNQAWIDSVIVDGSDENCVFTFSNIQSEQAGLAGLTIRNGFNTNGGGIYIDGSSPLIYQCRILDNHAYESGGGAAVVNASYPIFSYCWFVRNEVNIGGGGAVYCEESGPLFRNCLIARNITDVQAGGGIHSENARPVIINCTFTENIADGAGGAVFCRGRSEFYVANSIFWNNTLYEICLYDENSITVTYSDIEGGEERVVYYQNAAAIWGEGNVDHDPLFEDPHNFNYYLTGESPCIDTADPMYPEDPDGTRCDMGALYYNQAPEVEFEPVALQFDPFDGSHIDTLDVVFYSTGLTPLRLNIQTIAQWIPPRAFFFVSGNGQQIIQPDSSHTTRIVFTPQQAGDYEATYIIRTNDPVSDWLEIPISGTSLSIDSGRKQLPESTGITAVYPNPFNAVTNIDISLITKDYVNIDILDLEGRIIYKGYSGELQAGLHTIKVDMQSVESGIYFVRMVSSNIEEIEKVVLVQ